MNSFITAQCMQMQAMVKTFEQSIDMAAIKDDGKLSKEEAKMLKQLHAAAQRFRDEIGKATR